MTSRDTGWLLILALVLSALFLATWASVVHASSRGSLGALQSLPVFHEDRADEQKAEQLEAIARAVDSLKAPAGVPASQWRALVLAVGYHESAFSIAVHEGRCKPLQCDRGLARGPFQVHRNKRNEHVWDELIGVEHTPTQVRTASDLLRASYALCGGVKGGDWVRRTLSAYAGRACAAAWPGLETRFATYSRLARVMA